MAAENSVLEQLQNSKPVDGNVSAETIARTLNAHRNAILEAAGDQARLNERLSRTLPEMQKLLGEHQAGARMVADPLGGAAELDRFFLREDGTVRFKTVERTVIVGQMTVPVNDPGLLDSPSITREHEAVRQAYSAYALAFRRAKRMHVSPNEDYLTTRAFRGFVKALQGLPGRVGEFCRKMFADRDLAQRVISGAAGSGGELIGVPTTANVIRSTDLQRRIAGMVPMRRAPAPSFKAPIITGRALGRRRGSTASDPARYSQSGFTTSDRTVSVVDMAISALLDPQWIVDSATTIDDPMGMVNQWLSDGYADTLEIAMLHGDTAGTHQDTVSTWTLGGMYTAGDLDGSDSPAKFWIGFRARAFDDSNNYAGGGTFDITDHFGALALMGALAADAVVMTGLATLYKSLLPLSQFLTMDVFGPQATILTGQLGAIGGKPVVVSQMLNNDLASTGLYTGLGTTGSLVYANLSRYAYYEMDAGAGGDFDALYPERGAQYVGMVRRGILTAEVISGEKPCAVVVNL